MKIKKLDERTKTILLSIGIVLVLCIFGIRVVPRLLPHGPQGQLLVGGAHTRTTPLPAAAPILPAGPTPVGTTPTTGSASAAPQPTGPAMDPFWRPLALTILHPTPSTPAPVQKPAPAFTPPGKPGVTPGGGFARRPGSVPVMPIAPPPMPDVALQGIVQDETAVAVLEVGGQSRFMKVGERFEGGWMLAGIQAASVVLRQGGRKVVLTLGQSLPKETPQEHPRETPRETPQENPQENQDVHRMAQTLPPFHSVPLEH